MTVAFAGTLAGLAFVGSLGAGLVGVGGAIVMIPLLYYVPPWLHVGTLHIRDVAAVTMAQVLAASLVGAAIHGGAALVHRRLAAVAGSSMAAGSLAGAVASRYVSGRLLLATFGAMGVVALVLMLVPARPVPEALPGSEIQFDRAGALAYPGIIGLASGLVGAGGAFLLIPVLTALLGIPLRVSIGTSLAITVVAAATGFVGKLVTGQVPLLPTLAAVTGSLVGSAVGARLSRRVPVGLLRGVLAALIALATLRVWLDVLTVP